MKVTTIKVALDNSDNAIRDYDIKATVCKGAGYTVENGEVIGKETHTSLATFSSYGEDQLTPTFFVAEGRSAILAAIEGFIASGKEYVNGME